MSDSIFRIEAAGAADANRLAEIRVEAMRPSLEAVGRFDPTRARDRFLNTFCAADTNIIRVGDTLVGVFVVRQRADHIYLDHIYIVPAFQAQGIGRHILTTLKNEARSAMLPLRLQALNDSPANDFYRSAGFALISKDALDTHYEWRPE